MKKRVLVVIFIVLLAIICIGIMFIKTNNKRLELGCVMEKKVNMKVQIPVLMYHYIAGYGTDVSKEEDKTIISADAFQEQMEWLYDNGYKSLTMEEFICWKQKKCEINNKRFLLTIDDGFTSTYNLVEPILEKYNFTAVQFVVNEFLNEKTPTFEEARYAYMGYDYVENYKRNIIEIGSHTYYMHHQLPEVYAKVNGMTYEEILEDVSNSKKELNTEFISYPYGAYTDDLIKAVKTAGYKCGFALNGAMTYQNENVYTISRISAREDFESFKRIFTTDTYRRKSCFGL